MWLDLFSQIYKWTLDFCRDLDKKNINVHNHYLNDHIEQHEYAKDSENTYSVFIYFFIDINLCFKGQFHRQDLD